MRRNVRWYSIGSSATTAEGSACGQLPSQTSGERRRRLTVVVILREHIVDAFHLFEVRLCVTVIVVSALGLCLWWWLELLLFALVAGGDLVRDVGWTCGGGWSEL